MNNHLQCDVSLLVFIRQQKKYLSFTTKIENKIWNPARQRPNHKTTTLHCSNRPTQEAKCQIILLHVPHSKLPGVYEKISKNGKTKIVQTNTLVRNTKVFGLEKKLQAYGAPKCDQFLACQTYIHTTGFLLLLHHNCYIKLFSCQLTHSYFFLN